MTSEESFQAMLDANPKDHTTRRIFADWLDERDDPRAEGYRALGAHERFAIHNPDNGRGWWADAGAWSDYNNVLPPDWFALLRVVHPTWRDSKSLCPCDSEFETNGPITRRELEDAAALAFARLPADRKRELLAANEVPA